MKSTQKIIDHPATVRLQLTDNNVLVEQQLVLTLVEDPIFGCSYELQYITVQC